MLVAGCARGSSNRFHDALRAGEFRASVIRSEVPPTGAGWI
jgi:hypothetical protein